MDHTLSAKAAKFMSLENLYKYGIHESQMFSIVGLNLTLLGRPNWMHETILLIVQKAKKHNSIGSIY